MIKRIYLVGNPNVGKSVVFSRLTGVEVIASNYPGTTVEFSKGYLVLEGIKLEVIDLPGIYSLTPSSKADEVAVNLLNELPKDQTVVINILDATNLERNIFLTLELIEAGFAVLVCLNMCDDACHRGININVQKLQEYLKVPVVYTCAVTGAGIKSLIEKIKEAKSLSVEKLTHQQRWQRIGQIVETVQHLSHRHHTLRELLEDASVRPLSGLFVASLVVYLSFKIIRFLGESLINNLFDPFFFNFYKNFLVRLSFLLGHKGLLHHMLIGELIKGEIDFRQSLGLLTTAPYVEFAMVLPYVLAFYLVLGILEDIGFLPRFALFLDNILHRLGLHGYAIIPILLGFGCNVPGILATRILESKRERLIASTLISIGIPCVALQAMIFGVLGKFGGFYVSAVYLVLFSLWLILGLILNTFLKGYSPELLIEIPPYRFPPLLVILKKLFIRIKGFLFEALPIVFLGVLFINIILYFGWFDLFTGFFAPLVKGVFGLPKEAIIALAVGFLRKDVAVGMLIPLGLTTKQLFISTCLLAISFPCIATFIVLWKELGFKDFLKATLIMIFTGLFVGGLLNFFIP